MPGPMVFGEGVVSTGGFESHPAFTPDGRTLYFVRSTPEFTGWTIYVSHHADGRWSPPAIAPFSGRHRDADPFITADGSRLYFISDRPVGGETKRDMDIWVMDRQEGGGWGAPRNLGPPVNTAASEWFPVLTAGGTLYFGSGRPGGHGLTDLYRARGAGGAFQEPENLGPNVNSAADEYEGCVAQDESFLVFMAAGRPDGLGGGDLYFSERRGDAWTPARNLGATINGPDLEISPYLPPDGTSFFFSSARMAVDVAGDGRPDRARNGLGDIYLMDLAALRALGRDAPALPPAGRYRLQSNPWVNLHQRLVHEARFGTPPPAALAGDDLAAWKRAVEAYRAFVGRRSPIFDADLIRVNDALAATTTTALPDAIPAAAAAPLAAAMPLYRAAQWPGDDRANRFWIGVAEGLLASAGEELAAAHAKAYAVPFPSRILVDVTSFAWEFGAYTVGEGDTAHVVIASTVPGNQGFAALEMLMHEPSHAIVGAATGAIGSDLTRLASGMDVEPPRNLWHAILFYTSGALTRRALEARGVSDYRPVVLSMYERGFRGFRQALETHWQGYLDGGLAREEALRRILADTAAPKKKQP